MEVVIQDEWGQLNPQNKVIVEEYLEQIKNKSNSTYMITIARDGENPVRSVIFYDNVIDAADVYNSYTDWGFAKDFLTVVLYEPNGKIHKKVLRRPPGIEAVFMRRQYIEMGQILLEVKDYTPKLNYQKLVVDIAKMFKIDNTRFDEQRFFITTKCFVEE
jgi:hypothetical protein